jgi:hypothetical protein
MLSPLADVIARFWTATSYGLSSVPGWSIWILFLAITLDSTVFYPLGSGVGRPRGVCWSLALQLDLECVELSTRPPCIPLWRCCLCTRILLCHYKCVELFKTLEWDLIGQRHHRLPVKQTSVQTPDPVGSVTILSTVARWNIPNRNADLKHSVCWATGLQAYLIWRATKYNCMTDSSLTLWQLIDK